MGETLTFVLILVGGSIAALVAMGIIFSKLYRRATKEMSFVRTGMGGQKVIIDGGCLELPVFHDIILVNMQTLRLEVDRKMKDALITKDRMRVDVTAEFYVRVRPDQESVPIAAQTLGDRTLDKDALKELIEGKFIDALRSVAAEMQLEELHEKRSDFVQKVQGAVEEDLSKNGLELESVSLTSLDQTSKEHLDPNNTFDAQGLTKITETVELNNKKRNDLERKTEVEIARKNLEAEKERLNIDKDEQLSKLEQEKEIETLHAQQQAEIARNQSEQTKIAEQAKLLNEKEVDKARIENNREVEKAKIEKEKIIQESKINQQKTIEIAEQVRSIEVANKSQEQSQAKALADEAKAKAVAAEEEVVTVREKAEASRDKAIAILKAEEKAEQEAVTVIKAANAEAEAAKLKADAVKIEAEAKEKMYSVDAEGVKITNEAKNALNSELIALELKKALINAAPSIIKEMVKPIEKIDSIKVMDLKGLGSFGSENGGKASGASASAGNLAQQSMNAALQYKTQLPFLENLLKEIGMENGDFESLMPNVLSDKKEKPAKKALKPFKRK